MGHLNCQIEFFLAENMLSFLKHKHKTKHKNKKQNQTTTKQRKSSIQRSFDLEVLNFRARAVSVLLTMHTIKPALNSPTAKRVNLPGVPHWHPLSFLDFYTTPVALLLIETNGWWNSEGRRRSPSAGYHFKLFQTASQREPLIHSIYNVISISTPSTPNLNSPELRESLQRVINAIVQSSMLRWYDGPPYLSPIHITGGSHFLLCIF